MTRLDREIRDALLAPPPALEEVCVSLDEYETFMREVDDVLWPLGLDQEDFPPRFSLPERIDLWRLDGAATRSASTGLGLG